MRDAYVGIDVAVAKNKRLPVVICTWEEGRLIPLPLRRESLKPPRGHGNLAAVDLERNAEFAHEARTYIERVCTHLGLRPVRIGIDAPSSPCRSGHTRRAAEAAMDRAGIHCFATPSEAVFAQVRTKVEDHLAVGGSRHRLPRANQIWMLAGFSLYEAFASLAPCLEVFPQATARMIGSGETHKSRRGGVGAQLSAAAAYTGWSRDPNLLPEIGYGPGHDLLDAYLAAWVAALDEQDRIAFGEPPDDVIWVPRVSGAQIVPPPTDRARNVGPRSQPAGLDMAGVQVCPGCHEKHFRRWPLGWDAHAAHTCKGLKETCPEKRKAEYKTRFAHLFRR